MDRLKNISALPGAPQERMWLEERLKTLSVRESCILTAILTRQPPDSAADAVRCLQSLDGCKLRFPAGNYKQLGEFCMQHETRMPEDVRPYLNLERIGQWYAETHSGVFAGNCYVESPNPDVPQYGGELHLEDVGWSVRLKLSSPAVPAGVWMRLPAHDGKEVLESSEVRLALDALRAESLEECALLEARCVIPEAGDIMDQYGSITELVRDGNDLGVILESQREDEDHGLEKFLAALEYENCRTLRGALDIAWNLRCYDRGPNEDLEISAEGLLLDAGVPKDLIDSQYIDLSGYKAHLPEDAGYMLASDKSGYIIRNAQEFTCGFTAAEQDGMTMQ